MTIRAKHTLCSLKKVMYAHIWNTMFKNGAREKNFRIEPQPAIEKNLQKLKLWKSRKPTE